MAHIKNNLSNFTAFIIDKTGVFYQVPPLGSIDVPNELLTAASFKPGILYNWITVTGWIDTDEYPPYAAPPDVTTHNSAGIVFLIGDGATNGSMRTNANAIPGTVIIEKLINGTWVNATPTANAHKWDAAQQYNEGDLVEYIDGVVYKANGTIPIGQFSVNPPTAGVPTPDWSVLGGGGGGSAANAPLWNSTNPYHQYDLVTYNGYIYQANSNMLGGTNFAVGLGVNTWRLVAGPNNLPNWSSQSTYHTNDIVLGPDGRLYIANGLITPNATFPTGPTAFTPLSSGGAANAPLFDPTVHYNQYDLVSDAKGNVYQANSNIGTGGSLVIGTPGTPNTFTRIGGGNVNVNQWVLANKYNANDLVYGPNGDLYRANLDIPASTAWATTYSGSTTAAWVPATFTNAGTWSNLLTYQKGDMVTGPDGNVYVCQAPQAVSAVWLVDETHWEPVGNGIINISDYKLPNVGFVPDGGATGATPIGQITTSPTVLTKQPLNASATSFSKSVPYNSFSCSAGPASYAGFTTSNPLIRLGASPANYGFLYEATVQQDSTGVYAQGTSAVFGLYANVNQPSLSILPATKMVAVGWDQTATNSSNLQLMYTNASGTLAYIDLGCSVRVSDSLYIRLSCASGSTSVNVIVADMDTNCYIYTGSVDISGLVNTILYAGAFISTNSVNYSPVLNVYGLIATAIKRVNSFAAIGGVQPNVSGPAILTTPTPLFFMVPTNASTTTLDSPVTVDLPHGTSVPHNYVLPDNYISSGTLDTVNTLFGNPTIALSNPSTGIQINQTNYNGNGITALQASQPFTAEAWIRLPVVSSIQPIFGTNATGTDFGALFLNNGKLAWLNGGTWASQQATAITANTWHHVALVYNGLTVDTFLDGVSSGSPAPFNANAGGAGHPLSSIIYNNVFGCTTLSATAGNVSNIRFTQAALYKSNFTAPTQVFDSYVQANAYAQSDVVWKGGSAYTANSAISGGTAFVVGTGPNQWSPRVQIVLPALLIVPTNYAPTFNVDLPQDGSMNIGTSTVKANYLNPLFGLPVLDFDGQTSSVLDYNNISVGGSNLGGSTGVLISKPFTLEAWIYPTNISGSGNAGVYTIFASDTNANNCGAFYILNQNLCVSNASNYTCKISSIAINKWQHVALVYDGTNVETYLNGVPSGSPAPFAWSGSNGANATDYFSRIGVDNPTQGGGGHPFKGQMSNIRWTQKALYTAAFIPPTKVFDSWYVNQAYLNGDHVWYQGSEYVANSAIAANTPFAIGTGANQWTLISTADPYIANVLQYMVPNNASILNKGTVNATINWDIPANFTNSDKSQSVGTNSGTAPVYPSKFGRGSLDSNGVQGTPFSIEGTAQSGNVTGEFTAETWVYISPNNAPTSPSNYAMIFGAGDGEKPWDVYLHGNGAGGCDLRTGDNSIIIPNAITSAQAATGGWNHVALVRNAAGSTELYWNGTPSGTPILALPATVYYNGLFASSSNVSLVGALECYRLTTKARYTANFIPFRDIPDSYNPAAAYVQNNTVWKNQILYYAQGAVPASTPFAIGTSGATWNTKGVIPNMDTFYVLPSNHFTQPVVSSVTTVLPITDIPFGVASSNNGLNTVTNNAPALVGTPTKFGGGSLAFGNAVAAGTTTSFLHTRDADLTAIPASKPFTLEAFVYQPSSMSSGTQTIFGSDSLLDANVYLSSGSAGYYAKQGDGSFLCNKAFSPDTWHHVALTFDGTKVELYVDGVPSGSPFTVDPAIVGPRNYVQVGRDGYGQQFNGYMEMIAFWNYQKYTGAFTPPTTPYDTWNQSGAFAKGATVWKGGTFYYAQGAVPANTPFVIGTTGATWNTSEALAQLYVLPSKMINNPNNATLVYDIPYQAYASPTGISIDYNTTKLGQGSVLSKPQGLGTPSGFGTGGATLKTGTWPFTFEAWIMADHAATHDVNGVRPIIMSGLGDLWIMIDSYIYVNLWSRVTPMPDNTWTHVSLNSDGYTVTLYVNGLFIKSGPNLNNPAFGGSNGNVNDVVTGFGVNNTVAGNLWMEDTRFYDYCKRTGPFMLDTTPSNSWSLTQAYLTNDLVHNNGITYYAQNSIPANTPFAIGTTGATWSTTPVNTNPTSFYLLPSVNNSTPVPTSTNTLGDIVTALTLDYPYGDSISSSGGISGNHITRKFGVGADYAISAPQFSVPSTDGVPADKPFTLEAWIYNTGLSTNQCIFSTDASWNIPSGTTPTAAQYAGNIYIDNASSLWYFASDSSKNCSSTVPSNTWNHIAIVYDGSKVEIYVNGTPSGSPYTLNTTMVTGRKYIGIGSDQNIGNSSLSRSITIQCIRGSKTNLYSGAFTPPTAPFDTWNIAGNYPINATVWKGGVQYYAQSYIAANTAFTISQKPGCWWTSVALVFYTLPSIPAAVVTGTKIGTNGIDTTIPSSYSGGVFTGQDFNNTGTTSVDLTTTKFGDGSIRFNGSNNLSAFGNIIENNTSKYTIEFWFTYSAADMTAMTSAGTDHALVYLFHQFSIGLSNDGKINFNSSGNLGPAVVSSSPTSAGTWYHVALVNDGTSTTLFVNGTSLGAQTNSGQSWDGVIQYDPIFGGSGNAALTFIGNMEGVYYSDLVEYTGNFTVPTVPRDTYQYARTYAVNDSVWYKGVKYYAQGVVTYNTPFTIGTTAGTWNTTKAG